MNIFLSHSKENGAVAESLASALTDLGANVWLDTWALTPGSRWASEIQTPLTEADSVVFLLSSSSVKSQSLWTEAALAVEAEASDPNKSVIPVLLGRVKSIPPLLAQYSWIDASDLDASDVARRILAAIRQRRGVDKRQESERAYRALTTTLETLSSSRGKAEQLYMLTASATTRFLSLLIVLTGVMTLAASVGVLVTGELEGGWISAFLALASMVSAAFGAALSVLLLRLRTRRRARMRGRATSSITGGD